MTGLSPSEPRQARPGQLTVRLLRSAAELAALRPAWEDLLADSPAAAVTLTPAWLVTWWETFGAGRELCVPAVSDAGGRLLGFAPLLRRTVRHRGLLPLRRLEFLGSGEDEADETDSDYLDVIARAGHEEAVRERLFRYLRDETSLAWDELVLHAVPEQSPTPRLCREWAERAGLGFAELARHPGVVVRLPGSWDEYLARFSGKSRYNMKRERRLLDDAGGSRFEWTRDAAGFDRLWPVLVDLHQKRWQAAGKPGCFASRPFTAFHERLARELAPRGGARVAVLWVGERPVAARYQFVHNGVVYDYQSGQDPEFKSSSSPGNVLVGYCVEAAIAEGLRTYDFLKGVSGYKQTWSKDVVNQVRLRVARPGVRETLRGWIESGVGRVKRWRRAPKSTGH